jgi:hypothetical protein
MLPSRVRASIAALVSAAALLTVSCTDPPEKEMHQAQGAIEAARAAGAGDYAADELQAAEQALQRSLDAVKERDYRQALNFALDARERAQTAAREAAEARAVVRSEAERALNATDEALAGVTRALARADAAKVPAALIASQRRLAEAATTDVERARDAIGTGRYREAAKALDGQRERLTAAASEIDAVIEARSPRRPARRAGR